jgi:hypothetical protein
MTMREASAGERTSDMNAESTIAVRADGCRRILQRRLVAAAAAAALALGPAGARGADAAKPGPGGGKSPAVRFESIAGSPAKRIILTERAVERLGIETGQVGEGPIARVQMVGGLVVPAPQGKPAPKPAGGGMFGGLTMVSAVKTPELSGASATVPEPPGASAAVPVIGDAWVRVTLSRQELERLAKDKPARLFSLSTDDKRGSELLAMPSKDPPVEDSKRSMLSLHYVVPGKSHGLEVNKRVRVELEMSGNGDRHKVVPYGAVYYDAKGAAWVYVSPEPRVFERRRIGIDRVVGDVAVLTDGPPSGTAVVTVGAALLYGTEIFGK